MTCSWPVDRTCLPIADTDIDIAQQEDAENLAVQVLWALSGRQFGVCPVIARPCPQSCDGSPYNSYGSPFFVVWDGSNWRNTSCGCGPRCSWVSPNVVHLSSTRVQPVQEITEVVIGGEVLDESQYRLEGALLYRIGGSWPSQDLGQPLDQPGTWSVTYTRGYPPPSGTAKLVGLLAKEFLAACTGGKCRLPRRVKSVTRQGVSYDMVDPAELYRDGKTGIPEIDLWLSSVNPRALQSPPTVR